MHVESLFYPSPPSALVPVDATVRTASPPLAGTLSPEARLQLLLHVRLDSENAARTAVRRRRRATACHAAAMALLFVATGVLMEMEKHRGLSWYHATPLFAATALAFLSYLKRVLAQHSALLEALRRHAQLSDDLAQVAATPEATYRLAHIDSTRTARWDLAWHLTGSALVTAFMVLVIVACLVR